jgi:hypothetical protein
MASGDSGRIQTPVLRIVNGVIYHCATTADHSVRYIKSGCKLELENQSCKLSLRSKINGWMSSLTFASQQLENFED